MTNRRHFVKRPLLHINYDPDWETQCFFCAFCFQAGWSQRYDKPEAFIGPRNSLCTPTENNRNIFNLRGLQDTTGCSWLIRCKSFQILLQFLDLLKHWSQSRFEGTRRILWNKVHVEIQVIDLRKSSEWELPHSARIFTYTICVHARYTHPCRHTLPTSE